MKDPLNISDEIMPIKVHIEAAQLHRYRSCEDIGNPIVTVRLNLWGYVQGEVVVLDQPRNHVESLLVNFMAMIGV